MKKSLILGVDTSNYTTSLALCDTEGKIHANIKVPLPVKEGERGLRQSDALFHHTKNMPTAAASLREKMAEIDGEIIAVGYSATPREARGSYMPCFLAGQSVAELFSASTGIPIYKTSHQAGHIMAAVASVCDNSGISRDEILSDRFIAFHVSGGTTDVLFCEPDPDLVVRVTQIGGTRDINAGQAVDRVGVYMGLKFPAGEELDGLAMVNEAKLPQVKLSVDGTYCNLSGLENKATALYDSTGDKALTAAYTLEFVAKTLEKLTKNALAEHGEMPVIYAGGVMSSEYIKKTLTKYGRFASPRFSSDNAAGVALITAIKHSRKG